jgi:hypothetical protein
MNTRLASAVAAIVLSASAIASPALAQSYKAPAGIAAATAPGGLEGRAGAANAVGADDDLTTGSIGYGRAYTSAQQGNAEQNSFPVWQFGRTSGGTAR